jgi:FGFR1 oncogene partner
MQAELRANIYAILHETSISQGKPPLFGENIKLNRLRSSREGRILLDMIAEFMEFFEMQQTLTVFSAECSLVSFK